MVFYSYMGRTTVTYVTPARKNTLTCGENHHNCSKRGRRESGNKVPVCSWAALIEALLRYTAVELQGPEESYSSRLPNLDFF